MGCIRVPITAITAVVEAKMHPPLLSCAYFANQSLWFIFGHRLFLYPTILHSDGKDTAMKSETKKRKSGFNPNRGYYFTADGKNYCYERMVMRTSASLLRSWRLVRTCRLNCLSCLMSLTMMK